MPTVPPSPLSPVSADMERTSVKSPRVLRESTVALEGDVWHRIHDFDRLPPFLISLPSASDLWMFVSSASGLTCGRVDADGALFPYEIGRAHV